MDATRATQEDARTTQRLSGFVGECCANCNAPLAWDQRYCFNCGARHGRARFSHGTLAAQAAAAPAESAAPAPRRTQLSSGTTLVAGVATLLLALGVGVLIGHNGTSGSPTRAAAPRVITVGGGGGAGTAATSGAAPVRTAAPAAHGKASKPKVTRVVVTPKTAKATSHAASKVLGSGSSLSKNVQEQVGGTCKGGAGCHSGTFSGNFFPGG